MLLWSALALFDGGGARAEFLPSPSPTHDGTRNAWLLRQGTRLLVCWSPPSPARPHADCFEELPLPPGVDPGEAWRVRFVNDEELELLEASGARFALTAGSLWRPLPAVDDPDEVKLLHSSLFFAGDALPCDSRGGQVPRLTGTQLVWVQAPCERPCRPPAPPLNARAPGLSLRLELGAARERWTATRRDESTAYPSQAWGSQGWIGLRLGFDPSKAALLRRTPSRPRRDAVPTGADADERKAIRAIRCGGQP